MVPFKKRAAILETSELTGSPVQGDENTQVLAQPRRMSSRPPAMTKPSPAMALRLPKPAPVPRFPATLESPVRRLPPEEMTNLRGSVLRRDDDEKTMLRPMSSPPSAPVKTRSTPPPVVVPTPGFATRSAAVTASTQGFTAMSPPARAPVAQHSSARMPTASARPIPTPMDSVRAVVSSASRDASHSGVSGTVRPPAPKRRSWGAVAAMVGAFALLAVAIIAHGDAEGVVVAAKSLGSHGLTGDGVRSFAMDGDQAEFSVVSLEGSAVPEPTLPRRKGRGGHAVAAIAKSDPPVQTVVTTAPPPAQPQDDLRPDGTTPHPEPCDALCLWKLACTTLQAAGQDCGPAPDAPKP